MASAATVGADATLGSPLPYKATDEVTGSKTTITSAQHGADGLDEQSNSDAEDDGVFGQGYSAHITSKHAQAPEHEPDRVADHGRAEEQEEQIDKDLFGSVDEDEKANLLPRTLDDSGLDSGDDAGRDDRAVGDVDTTADEEGALETLNALDAELGPHPVPEPGDGELYLLKVPKFLGIEPTAFQPDTFHPPTTDLHSKKEASPNFSAYKTAMRTIRWRKDPKDHSKIQSNARILRWSDGSLTLQLGNDPSTQYLVPGHPLAPPQHNPRKPTPTSTGEGKRKQPQGQRNGVYNADQDAFTYLATPSQGTGLLRITNKITTSLQVELTKGIADDAVSRLQTRINTTKAGGQNGGTAGIEMVEHTVDPELKRKQAEQTEKLMLKERRNRDLAEVRERERTKRVGANLPDYGLKTSARTAAGGRKTKAKRQKRDEIYSDEEENWGARGRTKEDEYEEDDGFLVASSGSEEEPEASDEEEDIDEGIDLARPSSGKGASPRADVAKRTVEDQGGAAGEGSPVTRPKRRRVIEDDDDEE